MQKRTSEKRMGGAAGREGYRGEAWRGWILCLVLLLLCFPDRGCGVETRASGGGSRAAGVSRAEANPAVRKYRSVELSRAQTANIAAHEHLIHYFSDICYFRPRHRVHPDFIRALMLAESGGNPLAVSGKNALGLCQLLHPTARPVARELAERARGMRLRYVAVERLHDLQPEDLFDPAINILLTCYLVARYNYIYDGQLDLVVAAWNAGEGAILNGRAPNYPETQELIGKVNGYFLAFLRQRENRAAIGAGEARWRIRTSG